MLIDRPLDWNDLRQDDFSRQRVREIWDIIGRFYKTNEGKGGSITISLNGAWGTGKSSYLRAIGSLCEEKGYPFHLFEAWRYANEPDIFVALMESLCESLRGSFKGRMRRIFKEIALSSLVGVEIFLKNTLNLGLEDLEKGLKKVENRIGEIATGASKNRQKLQALLNEIRGSNPFYLLIDDLDRLTPEKAFRLIEELRFYFDAEGVVIVMAINDEVINEYAHEYHGIKERRLSEPFLEKLFQFRFDLSSAPLNSLHLRPFSEKEKKRISSFFEGLSLFLPHRKWINIMNRLLVKRSSEAYTRQEIALCALLELFPEFRYAYRRDQKALLTRESETFQECRGQIEDYYARERTLFDTLLEHLWREEEL